MTRGGRCRPGIAALAMALSVAAAATATCATEAPASEELIAFEPDTITEFTLLSDRMHLIAHRKASAHGPFDLTVTKDGRTTSCRSGPGFDRALDGLHVIAAKRRLGEAEALQMRGSRRALRLSLTAMGTIPLDEVTVYLPAETGGPLIGRTAHMDGDAELDLKPGVFALLEQGCAALGSKHP